LEVTHGYEHGWHPHIHALLFTGSPLTEVQIADLRAFLYKRWSAMVEKAGYGRPSPEHGLTICHGQNAGHYVAKMTRQGLAQELIGSQNKSAHPGHRSPVEIFADYAKYEMPADRVLILEYFAAMSGSRQMTWSNNGFRKKYLPPEQSDYDIVQARKDGQVVQIISIEGQTWDRLTKDACHWTLRIKQAYKLSGRQGVVDFLDKILDDIPP
jgi:hypothetical protein